MTLQNYGFLPKYSEEQNLRDRLNEKIAALNDCTTKINELNKKLQIEDLLPAVNEQFCAPMLQQRNNNRQDYNNELEKKSKS